MVCLSRESSETLNYLKCILALGVVMLHARYTEVVIGGENLLSNGDFDVYLLFIRSLKIFLQVCVPVYFLISGYLFFLNVPDSPDYPFFTHKYKSRIHTLFIPYIIGNLVVIVMFFFAERYLGGIMSGTNRAISDYSFKELLQSLWYQQNNDGPINEVLWFIRELMVMVLLSPLFYWLIKKTNYWCLIVLLLYYILDCSRPIPGLRPVALYFFSLGAFFSIKEKDVIDSLSKYSLFFALSYLILFLLAVCTESIYLEKLSVTVGVPLIIISASSFVKRKGVHIEKKWITATFFLYIYHNYPAIILKKLLIKIVGPS